MELPGWRACRSTLHSWAGWAGSLAPCNRIPRKEEARKALSAVVFIKAVALTPKQHQRLLRAPSTFSRLGEGSKGGRAAESGPWIPFQTINASRFLGSTPWVTAASDLNYPRCRVPGLGGGRGGGKAILYNQNILARRGEGTPRQVPHLVGLNGGVLSRRRGLTVGAGPLLHSLLLCDLVQVT